MDEIFSIGSSCCKTERDYITLQDKESEIKSVIRNFINFDIILLKETYTTEDSRDWKIEWAKTDILNNKEKDLFQKYNYKPFYIKHTFYTGKSKGFIGTPAKKVMSNFSQKSNIGIIIKKRNNDHIYSHCFVTNLISDINFLGGQSYVFPLWIYEEDDGLFGANKISNINSEFEHTIKNQYGVKELTETIFYYIYAILYCTKYRECFAEQLQIDYPKIPFTTNYKLFKTLSDLGKTLVELHLLTSKELNTPLVKFNGDGNNKVNEIDFREAEATLYINETQYFSGINTSMWEWEVGKNKPIQRWIKNAKDKELGLNETMEFAKICTAIKLTFLKQSEIDEHYEVILKDLLVNNCTK